ncbi:hypothetical protein ACFFRB_04160 [Kibdelosporangium aridum subsp. largum]|uniref:GP88 family protein n=1 Tax=Kibdelosporangium aridum TaxID=2030 RepID=UPI0035EBDB2E
MPSTPTSTASPTSSRTTPPSKQPDGTPRDESDLLAVLGPRLVGIPANRIPRALKLLGDRTFSKWQRDADAEREAQRRRRQFRLITGHPDHRRAA